MKKDLLINLVKQEASKLRKRASKEELQNIEWDALDPDDMRRCIYGQMTGNCRSDRAAKLITSCAPRLYSGSIKAPTVNGKATLEKVDENSRNYWSPIETFIWNYNNRQNGNNKILIDYLQGKTNRLNFKPF